MSAAGPTLGVDVGGTKALAVALDGDEVVWRATRATGRAFGPSHCVELVEELLGRVEGRDEVHAVGIGVPGLVDRSGRVRSSVILDGWHDVALAESVTARTGLECRVDNDVNNAARAELHVRRRSGSGAEDLLFVAVGTGIGGALVLDGRVHTGVGGLAGEVGHMAASGVEGTCDCGRSGCVAVAAGGRSIEARLGLAPGTLVECAHDARVQAELDRGAEALGAVLADAMHLLDLPLIVLGGGVAEHPGYVERVGSALRGRALPEVAVSCRVEPAVAGYGAGALGAAVLAASG